MFYLLYGLLTVYYR